MKASERRGTWFGCGSSTAAPSLWLGPSDATLLTPLSLPAGGPWGVHPAGRRTLLLSSRALLCAGPLFGEDVYPPPSGDADAPPPPPPPLRALPLPPAAVDALVCGWEHALLLCAGGALFAVGAGARGRLGLGDERDASAPARVPLPGCALAAAAGGAHSVALVEGAAGVGAGVFAWGCARAGALGGGGGGAVLLPAPSPAADALLAPGEGWAGLACGWAHTLALSGAGRVAAWGANRRGQCGAPPSRCEAPAWVAGLPRAAVALAAGWAHSAAALTAARGGGGGGGESGGEPVVWTWGRGDLGQLGREGAHSAPGPVTAAACACGGDGRGGAPLLACGAESTAVALPCAACAWSWGWNEHGNVGGGGGATVEAAPRRLSLPVDLAAEELRAAGATLFLKTA